MINPVGVKSMEQSVLEEQNKPESKLDSGIFGAAATNAFLFDEVGEWMDEQTQGFSDDPNWTLPKNVVESVTKDFDNLELDYLTKSESQREYTWRLNNIKRHREDSRNLAQYGNYGVGLTLGMSLFDPIGIAVGAASGGAGYAYNVGRIGRAAIGATVGASTGYAMAKFEQNYNTTVTDDDVLMSTLLSSSVEGLVAAIPKTRVSKVANEALVDEISKKTVATKGGVVKKPRVNEVDSYRTHLESSAKDIEDAKAKSIEVDTQFSKAKESMRDEVFSTIKNPKASDKKAVNSYLKRVEQIESTFKKASKSDAAKALKKKTAALKMLNNKSKFKMTKAQVDTYLGKLESNRVDYQKSVDSLKAIKSDKMSLEDFDSLPKEEQAKIAKDWNSVGAARTGDLIGEDNRILPVTDGEKGVDLEVTMDNADYNRQVNNIALPATNAATDLLQSVFTTMSRSGSERFRGLNNILFPNPQGAGKGGKTANLTASVEAVNAKRQMWTAGGGAMTRNKSYEKFLKENGKNLLTGYFNTNLQKKFNRDIMRGIDSREVYESMPDHMKEAVDSVAAQLKKALELQQQAGVSGFSKIKYNSHYVPKIMNSSRMLQAANKHGKATVLAVMSKAYQEGGFKLKPKTADTLAEMNYSRIMGNVSRGDTAIPVGVNRDQLVKEMRAAGMDDDTIASFFEARDAEEYKDLMSARAKRSVRPSLSSEIGGLSYLDLIDTNVESVIESYTREAAGNIGMARSAGIGSYKQAQRAIDFELKESINANPKDESRLQQEAQILRDGIDMIYGKSLDTENRGVAKNLSRLRQLTRILMLPMNGLTSAPELARPLFMNGLEASLKSFPAISRKRMTKLNREDLLEIDEVFSHVGEDHLFEPYHIDLDEFEEMNAPDGQRWADKLPANLVSTFDRALAAGGRLSSFASGQRLVQNAGEKLAIRSIIYNLKKGKVSEQRLRDAGWIYQGDEVRTRVGDTENVTRPDANFMDELQAFMKENPKKSSDGKYDLLNVEAMSPEMLGKLQRGVHLLASRDMQRMFVGELPVFMNKWVGAFVTQFKSFTYASLAKQAIHDVRSADKMKSAGVLLGGVGLAYAATTAKAALNYYGDEEAMRRSSLDRYLSKRLTGTGGVYNVMLGTGQLASAGLGMDALASLNLLPDDVLATAENGWSGPRGSFMPPSVSTLQNFGEALQGNNVEDVIPFAKAYGIHQILAQL